jgi:P4 family phage/plasmid primase-like protien
VTSLEHALYYASRGWRVIPIPTGYKYPHGIDQWQTKATTDEAKIRKYWTLHPDHGVGIATGPESGLWVLDVDPDDGGDDSFAALEAAHGSLPDTIEAITGGGGRHLVFAWPETGEIRNSASGVLGVGLDVRGVGGQIVAAPTVHPETGQAYAWEVEHDPFDGLAPAQAPTWLLELLAAEVGTATPRRERAPRPDGDPLPGDLFAASTSWADELGRDGWSLHSTHHDAAGGYYELWTRPGKTVKDGASASLYWQGSNVLKVFTSNAAPLAPGETYTLFGYEAAMRHGGDHQAAARAIRKAHNAATSESTGNVLTNEGPTTTPPRLEVVPTPAPDADGPEHLDQQPYSDLGNARRLIAEHGQDLRHAPQFGHWLAWDGMRWATDVTGEAQRRGKAVVDGMLTQMATIADADDRKKLFGHWMKSQSAPRLAAMVDVARTEPGVPVLVAQLDADPWQLNTTAGVVDLRDGQVHPAERRALVTKLAPTAPVAGSTCPTWVEFLDWAMQDDAELVEFIRRAVGYSLTGRVDEQVLFFLHGHGENGKSTFLNVLQAIMGDYAIAAEPDLLIAAQGDKHSTGIADLVGRRVAVVQETEEGRRFAEATVKQLTGGDVIRARRMRQDFFEFRPTHKLWMAANHKPNVRGTDHAIWRRIRLIPFMASLAPGQKDERLLDKLLAESAGIMQWALDGCLAWQRDGLKPPASVIEATQEYRTEQDHVGRFIEDVCLLDVDQCVAARDLRKAYEAWCEENGERPWSAKAMGPQLVERHCERIQVGSNREWTWIGIGLADRPRKIDFAVALGRVGKLQAKSSPHAPEVDDDLF